MATYRISRNIEASIIDYIDSKLVLASWDDISVQKTFKKIYDIPVDSFSKTGAICVRISNTLHDRVEVGSNSTKRVPLALINIFATSDGQRLDLKDYLISVLKTGIPYYEYTVSGNSVTGKALNGRLTVENLRDEIENLGVEDKSMLTVHDRYRHLISLNLHTGKVE